MPGRRDLLRAAEARLRAAGVASPQYDAAELLAHVLGVARGSMTLIDDVGATDADRFDELIGRRCTREPLQHLTGVAGFRYVELAVGPGVFVPRPETELLAGWAVEACSRWSRGCGDEGADAYRDHAPVVVDLCTGSGAIARSIAEEVPTARVFAVELADDAHRWAMRNLEGSGVELRHGDMAEAFPELDGSVDVVTCNPPYIPLEAWESVADEARNHDPDLALYSGPDGLDAMRVLEQVAARLLRPGGVVGAEHADAQGDSAPAVFTATGRWVEVRDNRDLAGRPRFLTARLAR